MKCGRISFSSTVLIALGLAGVLAACGGVDVAKGQAVLVPNLFCLTPVQARTELTGAKLVGLAHLSKSAPVPIGSDMVYSQSPPAGRDVPAGTAVTYYATTGTRKESVAECRSYYQRGPS